MAVGLIVSLVSGFLGVISPPDAPSSLIEVILEDNARPTTSLGAYLTGRLDQARSFVPHTSLHIKCQNKKAVVRIVQKGEIRAERQFGGQEPASWLEAWLFVRESLATDESNRQSQPQSTHPADSPFSTSNTPIAPKVPPQEPAWRWSAEFVTVQDRAELASLGVLVGIARRVAPRWHAEAHAGFRTNTASSAFSLHTWPVTLGVMHQVSALWWVGAIVEAHVKHASIATQNDTSFGGGAGASLSLRVPLEGTRTQLSFRGNALGRFRRQRFLSDNGNLTERAWQLSFRAGVHW